MKTLLGVASIGLLLITPQARPSSEIEFVGSVVFESISSKDGSLRRNPVGGAEVAVYGVAGGGAERRIGQATTSEDGVFAMTIPVPADVSEIFVQARTFSRDLVVGRGSGTTFRTFTMRSSPRVLRDEQARVGPFDLVSRDEGTQPEFSGFEVFEAARRLIRYVRSLGVGRPFDDALTIRIDDDTYYSSRRREIELAAEDGRDWDVLYHELGHVVQDDLRLAQGPGGEHSGEDLCKAPADRVQNPRGWSDEDWATRLAWAEGWATFFGLAVQRELGMVRLEITDVGDHFYHDIDPSDGAYWVSDDLESRRGLPDTAELGEGNEVAVARVLWDLFDDQEDGPDTLVVESLRDHLTRLEALAARSSGIERFGDAWQDLTFQRDLAAKVALGAIAARHGMGATLLAPAGAVDLSREVTFEWTGSDCGQPGYAGHRYRVHVWDPAFQEIIWISDETPAMSAAMPDHVQSQLRSAAGEPLLWFVETHNRALPAPRTYYSEARAFTVSRLPGSGHVEERP